MAIKDFEMNIKNADGSYDILHPITKAKNVLGLDGEIGKNANGNYVKFRDGTLICWNIVTTTYYNSGSLRVKWVFPAQFIDSDYHVSGTNAELPTINARLSETVARYRGLAQVEIVKYDNPNTFTEVSEVKVNALAIGRWK